MGHSAALDAFVWFLHPNSARGRPRDCSTLGLRLAIEVLFIGHDGHHSISLTNSPNGGLHARHLPLHPALVAVLLFSRRGVCTRSGRRSMSSQLGSAASLQTGTHSQMHRISRILEMESRHGITPAIRQRFVFPMRVAELLHL